MGRKKALCPELLGPWLALERDPSTFRLQNLTVDCCSLPAAGQAESKRSKLLSSFWYFFKRYVIIYKALVRNHCICVLSFVTLMRTLWFLLRGGMCRYSRACSLGGGVGNHEDTASHTLVLRKDEKPEGMRMCKAQSHHIATSVGKWPSSKTCA